MDGGSSRPDGSACKVRGHLFAMKESGGRIQGPEVNKMQAVCGCVTLRGMVALGLCFPGQHQGGLAGVGCANGIECAIAPSEGTGSALVAPEAPGRGHRTGSAWGGLLTVVVTSLPFSGLGVFTCDVGTLSQKIPGFQNIKFTVTAEEVPWLPQLVRDGCPGAAGWRRCPSCALSSAL